MTDHTEGIRRVLVGAINSQVESREEDSERERLEAKWGQVWNTKEVQEDFEVLGFLAPFVVVREKATGKKGAMMFQHHPRFYFNFEERQGHS